MVVFVDLESSDDEPSSPLRSKLTIHHHHSVLKHSQQQDESLNSSVKENRNSFAATLTCYPYAESASRSQGLMEILTQDI